MTRSVQLRIPAGFVGGSTSAGLKPSGARDLSVILSERPCAAAGLFTRNLVCGANIPLCREHLGGRVRGIVVNAGQANVCTGDAGAEVAARTARKAAELAGCRETEILVGSTGVIGVLPDVGKIEAGLEAVFGDGLSRAGLAGVTRSILTTDLVPKTASRRVRIGGRSTTVFGMAKGSGMIHPNMGTMLAYILTDAAVSKRSLNAALRRAADRSFHCMTVDGDTSTSDMVVALANGAAGGDMVDGASEDFEAFEAALTAVCESLARQVAADGEGATRLVTVRVRGAKTEADARMAAMAVARSSLVKSAIFGRDPNWGRIACALGYSGARFDPARLSIRLAGRGVFSGGQPSRHNREEIARRLADKREVTIEADLGAGKAHAVAWTCDLTYDYVRINAEYTT